MKILKVVLIGVLVALIALAGATAYVVFNARDLLVGQLTRNLGVDVKVGAVRIALPQTVMIEDVTVGTSVSFARLSLTPSVLGFLRGEVVLNSVLIEKPRATLTRRSDGTMDYGIPFPAAAPETASGTAGQAPASSKAAPAVKRVYVGTLKVTDGTVFFIDKAVDDGGPFEARLEDVNIDVNRMSLLEPLRMNLKAEGRVVDKKDRPIARVKATGSVDIWSREGDLKVELPDVQLIPLKAYYMTYMKRELSEGVLAATGDFRVVKNDLSGDLHVELNGVAFLKPAAAEGSAADQVQGLFEDAGMLAFQSVMVSQGKSVFDVSFRTRLDNPRFENVKIKGAFMQPKIEQVLSQPSGQTVEQYKQIGEQFEEIGKQFKKIFKGE